MLFIGFMSCKKKAPADCIESQLYSYDYGNYWQRYGNTSIAQQFQCDSNHRFQFELFCDTIAIVEGKRLVLNLNPPLPIGGVLGGQVDEISYRRFRLHEEYYSYSLYIQDCDNTVAYQVREHFGGISQNYTSENIDSASCWFKNHITCDSGPDNNACFSSKTKQIGIEFGNSNYLSLIPDSDSLYLDILLDPFRFRIPTNSTMQLLPGNYWLGAIIPPGDQQLLNCSFYQEIDYFNNFTSGNLNVIEVGTDTILSWRLHSCDESLWTGYFKQY